MHFTAPALAGTRSVKCIMEEAGLYWHIKDTLPIHSAVTKTNKYKLNKIGANRPIKEKLSGVPL